jgi:hypothetical protein
MGRKNKVEYCITYNSTCTALKIQEIFKQLFGYTNTLEFEDGDRYKVTFSIRSNFMLDFLQSFYGCISGKT